MRVILSHRFPNDPCASSNGVRNGTCYTVSECRSKSGISSGTCASGFGVCCVCKFLSSAKHSVIPQGTLEQLCNITYCCPSCLPVSVGCGSISNENCTYFTVLGASSGSCSARICPCSGNICQVCSNVLREHALFCQPVDFKIN